MKRRYYIIIAVASYLLFSLSAIPAASIYSLLPGNMPIKLYGIEGSIWNGRADSAVMPSKPPVQQIQWQLSPFALLLASISADFNARFNEQPVVGNVRLSASGSVSISRLKTSMAAAEIAKLASIPLGEFDGEVFLDIESASLSDNAIPNIIGDIVWQNAKVTLTETVELGQISIKIRPQTNGDLLAKLANDKGSIDIRGDVTVSQNKAYKLNIVLTPKANTSPNITQSLGFFAKRQANGSYRVKQNGNLRQFGL
ncbi:MAG: type II secretion system protein N [Gammaproteobacteria bacterium]